MSQEHNDADSFRSLITDLQPSFIPTSVQKAMACIFLFF